MKPATLALGLALSASLAAPLAASTPAGLRATVHRGSGVQRIELSAGEAGWTFQGDAARGVHVLDRGDGTATVLVLSHVLAAGPLKVVMSKDGEAKEVTLAPRIRA